jgi:hypothetical protein
MNNQHTYRIAMSIHRRQFLAAGGAAVLGGLLAESNLAHALLAQDDDSAPLRLITRADDIGAFRSLNRAVEDCLTLGIARNASVLAPTPFVEEAAEALAGLEHVCFGLHTALNAEWTSLRWGPVAPREKVRSLIDDDGNLHQYLPALKNADADEALIELTAQLEKARKLGFDIRYADSHMGAINQVPGLADRFAAWCASNRIIDARKAQARRLPGIPDYWGRPDHRKDADFVDVFLKSLKAAERGPAYLIVGHAAYADEETRALGHDGYPGEAVAANLDLERRAFVAIDVVKYCKSAGVRLMRYDEVVTER